MAGTDFINERSDRWWQAGPTLTFIVAILASALATGVVAQALHLDYALPLASTALFVFAAAAAAFGWRHRHAQASPTVTYWDVAGALTLIGICAAATVDPEQMMRVMDTRTD